MNHILYSATDLENNKRFGYAKANSNREVLTQLQEKNLKNIQLYGDILFTIKREDIDSMDEQEQEKNAKYEVESITNPSLINHIKYGIKSKRNLLIILGGLFLIILGLFFEDNWVLVIGFFISLSVLILLSLSYIFIYNLNKIHKAMTYGNWDRAEDILNSFYNYKEDTFPKDVKFELDTIAAKLLAINHNPEGALDAVKNKYGLLKNISPLKYQILLADIHAINGNYNEYISAIQEVYELHPHNAVAQLDMALADAYFGDKIKSEHLLNEIHLEELPVYALPIWNQIKGVVLIGQDNMKALDYFKIAFQEIEIFKNNPLMLQRAAILAGYNAIVLFDNNEKEHAKNMLENYWDILKVYGHKYLLEDIYTRLPYFKDID